MYCQIGISQCKRISLLAFYIVFVNSRKNNRDMEVADYIKLIGGNHNIRINQKFVPTQRTFNFHYCIYTKKIR